MKEPHIQEIQENPLLFHSEGCGSAEVQVLVRKEQLSLCDPV